MAKSVRSQNATQKAAPPPIDDLRNDLDELAARVVARSLGKTGMIVPTEPSLDIQIDALKTVGGYWSITRKGAGGSSPDVESAYEKYRNGLNGAQSGSSHVS